MRIDHRPYARAAIAVAALALGGCTTSHFYVSGHPSIVKALDKLVPHPQPNCSVAEAAELSLRAEQTYSYISDSRGVEEWVTLTIDRSGRCMRLADRR